MDYGTIKAEIARDGYKGMDDAEIAAALNAKTISIKRRVPTYQARAILLKRGVWGALCIAAEQTNIPVELRAAAITARDTMLHTETMDTDEPEVEAIVAAMMSAFVQAGLMAAEVRDELLALIDGVTSRAAQLGLGPVAAGDVATARVY